MRAQLVDGLFADLLQVVRYVCRFSTCRRKPRLDKSEGLMFGDCK